ncbi:MAG TPA: polyribonucleotide nucleotidyltransferase [Candidatus Saccharimonadia bacterium]|jgi:polyribonucleotide nucleotidyltransferase|nr:polyribonucleotide nucleotidyltransferase [Candidatus Saccharimonadia bacterium]
MEHPIIHPFGGKTRVFKTEFCGRELSIETGKMGFLADGAVMVRYGDTVVFGTAVVANTPREGVDFFPLLIDYEERFYAAGKISGSRFIKREGKASEHATLSARLIDRPVRPLFPKGYRNDVQSVALVVSADLEFAPNIIAMTAVSAALSLSGAPFEGPVAGVRVGLVDGKLVAFPSEEQMKESKLDLTVAGTKDAIMMVEAGAMEVDEATMIEAIELAHKSIQPVIKLQEEMVKELGVKAKEFELMVADPELAAAIKHFLEGKLGPAIRHQDHYARHDAIRNLEGETVVKFSENYEKVDIETAFRKVIDMEIRRAILEEGARPDGRGTTEVRPISAQVGLLPRTHGSALFTRGSTQVLNVTTLASTSYAQLIDTMEEDTTKRYMHHYNAPGYSGGEVKPMRSPGRREIGHGALAERALLPVIPAVEDFPYTIRTVSEVISQNGSSSMASVCGSTLSLMDAGVPIVKPVAGIAMGLVTDHEHAGKYVILSDIQGAEDFAGDMDFKVAGTKDGITALQMDIKVKGITPEIMKKALAQAKEGRDHIMGKMLDVLDKPRAEMSPYAPRISKLMINPEKIALVIGKGGETINKIIAETGVEIDIEDSGLVMIASTDAEGAQRAIEIIRGLTEDPEVGKIYTGKVVKIMEFGAFVNIMPGKDGLVHISQLADSRVAKVEDVVKVGDVVKVKLMEVDPQGRLNLSLKAAKDK